MNTEKKKCIMLYDDVHGMGHLPFFQYICSSLKEEYNLFVLLGNGLSEEYFPGAQVIRIEKKLNSVLHNSTRMNQIERVLFRILPDIFLIDFFPFGRYGNILEINLITSFIKNRGGKNISIMRDIYLGKKILDKQGYNKFLQITANKKGKDISSIIENDYRWLFDIIFKGKIHHIFLIQAYLSYTISKNIIDGILIFGDKNIFNISQEFILDSGKNNVFHHLGYIPGEENKHANTIKDSILISTGGNITSKKDFKQLILYMNNLSGYSIRIVLGPFIDREYKKEVISIVHKNKNIHITGFVENFSELLYSSEYFFGFGGYGTFQSLFNYQGEAFIMSNYDDKDFRHRFYEQKYRTIHLQDFLNVSFLNDFSPKNLDSCFNGKKKEAKKQKLDIDFCSPEKLRNVITEMISLK